MDYKMSEQLSSGVRESCFSFAGVKTIDGNPFPICKSTLHPLIGYCTHKPPNQVSPASQKSRPTSKSKSTKPSKIMVSVGGKLFEQAHFNDYLKQLNQLKQERKANG